ncbi:MAG: class I adenylate-forming enzyme family protein [Tepidisphaeraceae bacterium]
MSERFALLERITEVAAADPARLAYHDTKTGKRLSYGELIAAVGSVRSFLKRDISAGDVVMLRCGNRIEFAVWFLALIAQGHGVYPINPQSTEAEAAVLAERVRAAAVVGARPLAPAPRHWAIESALSLTGDASAHAIKPGGYLLLSSSGTTGLPKIVQRSRQSLDAVARAMVNAIGFVSADRVLACVPLTHSYGIEHGLLAPLRAGCGVHVCEGFDLSAVGRVLGSEITVLPAVPAMIEMLTTLADAPDRLAALRRVYSAGGPLSPAINERFTCRYHRRVGQVYGMTEIGSVTFNDPDEPDFVPQSVGRAMENVSIRIQPAEDGAETVQGESAQGDTVQGEIAVRAASMFDGYFGESATLSDGFFPTGDLGHLDAAGRLIITGRSRLLIDIGARKVNPLEVEDVLCQHPGVRECVVISMRQSETIRRLRAIVVPEDHESAPSVESIRQFARARLAPFKVPRQIEFWDALPRSATGKVLRQQLEAS